MYFLKKFSMFDVQQQTTIQQICEKVQKNMANTGDEIDWGEKSQIFLFYSMFGQKPVGVHRHFIMMAIHQRFSNYLRKEVSSKVIWDHLNSLYDMSTLHESENIPFPNEEVDFELSEDFDDVVNRNGITLHQLAEEHGISKNGSKLVKKSLPKLKPSTSTSDSKGTFLAPASVKPIKSSVDIKPSTNDGTPKKLDVPLSSKGGKVKRSSSPFPVKNIKIEPGLQVKEEVNETPTSKKVAKVETSSSSAKKASKSESHSSTGHSKKSIKQEISAVKIKSEPLDTSSKRNKNEKEAPVKKSRVSAASENSSKKSSKAESKKNDSENSKKSNEATSHKTKHEKSTSSSRRSEDTDSSSSGSRKHSVGKADPHDKKRKRQKVDEAASSGKKSLPPPKRRRI